MVKSCRSHYASHCIVLHYDDDDIDFDNDDDCVALASDDDDDSSGHDDNLHSPYISDLFFLFSMMPFLLDADHLIKLINHLDLLCRI